MTGLEEKRGRILSLSITASRAPRIPERGLEKVTLTHTELSALHREESQNEPTRMCSYKCASNPLWFDKHTSGFQAGSRFAFGPQRLSTEIKLFILHIQTRSGLVLFTLLRRVGG